MPGFEATAGARTLIYAQPQRRERVAAALVVAFALAAIVVALPEAGSHVGAGIGVFAMVYASLMLAAVAVAWMTALLYRLTAFEPLFVLAAAYAYAATMVALYVVSFPGVVAPAGVLPAGPGAAWFWCFAHAGYACFLLLYALAERLTGGDRPAPRRMRAIVRIATVGAFVLLEVWNVALVMNGRLWLPALVANGRFVPGLAAAIAPILIGAYAAAFTAVVVATRLRSTVALWIAVVAAALGCDVLCEAILAPGYFTRMWYVGMIEGAVAGVGLINVVARLIAKALSDLTRSNEILAETSIRDGLTNLLNRRSFEDRLTVLLQELRRRDISSASLLIVDIDHFKAVNDRFGHVVGDGVIRGVAVAIARACTRSRDTCFRIGGEEFAIVLPATDAAGAGVVAERVRVGVASFFRAPGGGDRERLTVTVSVGYASMEGSSQFDASELYHRADVALLAAKRGGRNRSIGFDGIGRDRLRALS